MVIMAEFSNAKSPGLLGQTLKQLRETHKESLAEAAGAIEIDESQLAKIEAGQEIPSEDLLYLLTSHFRVDPPSADRLRQLAGYDNEFDFDGSPQMLKMPVVVIGVDQRVVYSDGVHVDVNPNGVVLNFLQAAAGPNQPRLTVSRVGMSLTQAETVAKTLERALLQLKYMTGPKRLPESDKPSNS
jgi:DNA-binding XRE family transcriptional regulator